MDWIAIAIALSLFLVAGVHALWALGSFWPAKDETSLAKMVVGTPGITTMPPRSLTALVTVGIAMAGLVPLFWRALLPYPHILPQTLLWLAMWALALVFLLRGAATYLPLMNELEQPFAQLNRTWFSPLILAIGLGYLVLVLEPVLIN